MTSILSTPGNYVQGPDAIHDVGAYVSAFGKRALLMGGPTALSVTEDAITDSLAHHGVELCAMGTFEGEATWAEINRFAHFARESQSDIIIGVGGGKALDTAKGVAHETSLPIVSVPTLASTGAPCSGVSGIYNAQHEAVDGCQLPAGPEVCLVDTRIILDSPVRFTVAGMGDALSTMFEADACVASNTPNLRGGKATMSGLATARLCYELVMEHGRDAKRDAESGTLSEAFERVVEANTLLSGVGFENCGLSVAHGLWVGFTRVASFRKLPVYHGEAVGLFTLVQLVLEKRPSDYVDEIVTWCNDIGLPVCFADIGLTEGVEEALRIGIEATCVPGGMVHHVPFEVTPESLHAAMMETDAIGRASKAA